MKLKDWNEDGRKSQDKSWSADGNKGGNRKRREEALLEDSFADLDMDDMNGVNDIDEANDMDDMNGMEEAPGNGLEDDWEEEAGPLRPWGKVLIFFGLAVPAAIICAVLWTVIHPERPEKPEGDGQNIMAETTQTPQPSEEIPEGEEQSSEAPESGQTPEPEEDFDSEQDMEPAGTQEPEKQPATQATSDAGTVLSSTDAGEVEKEPVSGDTGMTFGEVQESVTPKDVINLRSSPTTKDESNVVVQAKNGETLSRSGINSSTGWSRIEYNGQTLFAVTGYLTTDLNYKPPLPPSDPNRVTTISGRIIIFANCDDWITPKEYVNLRTEPSTSEGEATVSCQLNNGEKAHRTGYSTDAGWSRVEYNGQVLYVVTSLMNATSGE